LDRRITSLSTSRKYFVEDRLTEEGDLEGRKMASIQNGLNFPFGVKKTLKIVFKIF
jgi:hypothetical protein